MKPVEQIELSAFCSDMIKDVNELVEKHRSIFEWDALGINVHLTNTLIFEVVRKALDDIEDELIVTMD